MPKKKPVKKTAEKAPAKKEPAIKLIVPMERFSVKTDKSIKRILEVRGLGRIMKDKPEVLSGQESGGGYEFFVAAHDEKEAVHALHEKMF